MKVLFLLKSGKTPSSRIRVLDLLPALRKNGIEPDVEILPDSFWKRRKLFKKAKDYPVTVLQKRLLSIFDFGELRKNAKRLVFDFDDAIYCKNASCSPDPADYESSTRKGKFKRTVAGSDLVIAANNVLAGKVREFNKAVPVEIIPSSVDVSTFVPKADYNLSSPPVVGWIGTKSTLRYLELISSAFTELRSKRDFVLRIISDEPYRQGGINVEFVRWSLENQNTELIKFDIGIMPLSGDPFSEGKASYKLLQYLAAGVPSICSPVGMNSEVSDDGEYCLAASDSGAFASQMLELLDNCEFRRNLGVKGRKLIEQKYGLEGVASKLAEAFLRI
ncbi:MAG: glycosyltransferase family 4 protein [Lentisphaerae bacterium]|nr:glycosyltransferase family 4 protein [Lentisphaerota bacterium]